MPLNKLPSSVRMLKDSKPAQTISSTSWREGKTTNERGYTYAWQKAREQYLRENPTCRLCVGPDGFGYAAEVVDHIEPHRGDMTLFWSRSNWQPLCKQCHDSVKQKQERRSL